MIGFMGFACRPLQYEAIICSLSCFINVGHLSCWTCELIVFCPSVCSGGGALLALGQFQHALDELLAWLTAHRGLLSEQKPVGRPQGHRNRTRQASRMWLLLHCLFSSLCISRVTRCCFWSVSFRHFMVLTQDSL